MTDKSTLRTQIRAAREAAAGRSPIPVPESFRSRLERGLTVTSYVPVRGEADPSLLARAAMEAGCVLALPHVTTRAAPMRFLAWDTEAALAAGPFGLHQPHNHMAELRPDIILTPLVAFDRTLNRLGQGAGYYDRAFAAFPDAWRVGIAFADQQVDALPAESWDVPLHAIATDKEWITL